MTRVLIATQTEDIHATLVKDVLEHKGHEAILWYGADFPTRQSHSVRLDSCARLERSVLGTNLEDWGDFDVVWCRRPTQPQLPQDMHAGDRKFATRECRSFVHSLWSLVSPEAFWVNPYHNRPLADSKIFQLKTAVQLGMQIPSTLCSNEPGEIREFIRNNHGSTVYKPFLPSWWTSDSKEAILYTSLVTEEDLPDNDILRLSPGIFQRKIEKSHELRVTFMGDHAFAARLDTQDPSIGIDWRQDSYRIPTSPVAIPDTIAEKCRALMTRLGIVFGCFDFIVTPNGDYVFLEVNEMGQFIWLEEVNHDFQLLDAFCEFLIHGRRDFHWQRRADSVHLKDFQNPEALNRYNELDARHVGQSPAFVLID